MEHEMHDGIDVVSTTGHLAVIPRDEGSCPVSTPTLARAVVVDHHHVADRYWYLRVLAPSIAATAQPGQFVMITIARDGELGPVLPRPMAIYATDAAHGYVDVMYGVVGAGTTRLTTFAVGETLTIVGPLGRGFVLNGETSRILLIGRGIGTCSLTALAFSAAEHGVSVVAVDSARTAHALVADRTYRRAGVERLFQVTDSEGSSDAEALRQTLTRELDDAPPQQIYVCGSNRLIRLCIQLGERWGADTQVSLEAHMACGLGYCHGCSSGQRTADTEAPLICHDGPVFRWSAGASVPA